jgi:excisionase family DNA binding protein
MTDTPTEPKPDRLLSTKDVMDRLNLGKSSVEKLFNNGTLTRIMIGTRSRRARESEVDAYIAAKEAESKARAEQPQ